MKHRTIVTMYDQLNARNFGGVLVRPVIRFTRARKTWGHIELCTRQTILSISREVKGLDFTFELMYHEMIHQYIEEFLYVDVADDHGTLFDKTYRKFLTPDIVPDYQYEGK